MDKTLIHWPDIFRHDDFGEILRSEVNFMNKKTSFFTRILIILLATVFFLQMPVSARPEAADNLVDNLVYLPLVLKNYDSSTIGSVTGYVRDARTQVTLEGAEVCYQDTICDTTGTDGRFSLNDISVGGRFLTAAAIGYGKGTEYVFVVADTSNSLDFNLLRDLEENQIRVVLTWDPTRTWGDNIPNDLNLHMWTDYDDPNDPDPDRKIIVNIDNVGNCQDLEASPYSCYENDEQYGTGPDTIVLLNNDDDFKFGVLNQNASFPGVPLLTELSARVQVFDASGSIQGDYPIESTGDGDLWLVFEILGGNLSKLDCITSYPADGYPEPSCP